MTFGDVLAIALLIAVTVITLWAGIVAFAVLFSRKARVAADALVAKPGKQIGIGAVVCGIAAAVAVSLMSKGGPVAMFGFAIAAAVLALAVLGSAGLSMVVADRLRSFEGSESGKDAVSSPLLAIARGAGLCMAAGLIPVIGWFFLFPAAVFASLGAGFAALTARKKTVIEPVAVPVPAEL